MLWFLFFKEELPCEQPLQYGTPTNKFKVQLKYNFLTVFDIKINFLTLKEVTCYYRTERCAP